MAGQICTCNYLNYTQTIRPIKGPLAPPLSAGHLNKTGKTSPIKGPLIRILPVDPEGSVYCTVGGSWVQPYLTWRTSESYSSIGNSLSQGFIAAYYCNLCAILCNTLLYSWSWTLLTILTTYSTLERNEAYFFLACFTRSADVNVNRNFHS